MKRRYLLQLLEDDPRRLRRLIRLLKKKGVTITSIIISIEMDDDPRILGLLGGLKTGFNLVFFEGILPIPIIKGRMEKVKEPEVLYYNA